jgi:hypothetical protein
MGVDWNAIRVKLETALNAALDNPSPTYSINGQSVSFESYIAMLRRELAEAEKMEARATGPWSIKKTAIPR